LGEITARGDPIALAHGFHDASGSCTAIRFRTRAAAVRASFHEGKRAPFLDFRVTTHPARTLF
jgi:hypothetical protein